MARVDPTDHLRRPWRVHDLAADFDLLDVWEYPIRARPPHDLRHFDEFAKSVQRDVMDGSTLAGLLFRIRAAAGRVFGWDERRDRSLQDRLEPRERSNEPDGLSPTEGLGFDRVYQFEDELLDEISNSTVHALMHVSWIEQDDGTFVPRMAVYVKPRGLLGRLYMALISPFRHLLVYPTLMRRMGSAWAAVHS